MNYAILCNLSKNFFNFRHYANVQLLNNLLLTNGYDNKQIVIVQPEDISYHYKDHFKNINSNIYNNLYNSNILNNDILYNNLYNNILYNSNILYNNNLITNTKSLLNILYLHHHKLMTINEHDNLLIYMCGHANEDFFKIADRYYLCKEEITELVSYLRKRVGKLMVIVDTCQAECLIDRDKILNNNKYNNKYNSNILNNDNILNNNKYNDNIIILTTSIYNQYSYSTHVNNILGINIVDDFIYELYNNILNSNTDILNSNISNNTNILYNDNNISNIRNIRNISNNNNISNIRNIRNISNNNNISNISNNNNISNISNNNNISNMLVSDYFKYNFILDTSTITINDNNILRIEDFFYNKNKIYNDNKNKIYNDTIYNDNKIYNKNNNTIYDKKVNKFII